MRAKRLNHRAIIHSVVFLSASLAVTRTTKVASCAEGRRAENEEQNFHYFLETRVGIFYNDRIVPKFSSTPCSICDVRTWLSILAFLSTGPMWVCVRVRACVRVSNIYRLAFLGNRTRQSKEYKRCTGESHLGSSRAEFRNGEAVI